MKPFRSYRISDMRQVDLVTNKARGELLTQKLQHVAFRATKDRDYDLAEMCRRIENPLKIKSFFAGRGIQVDVRHKAGTPHNKLSILPDDKMRYDIYDNLELFVDGYTV